jgi:DNA-binding XRE family transcriptional regulator
MDATRPRNKIREYREMLHLTQAQLAKATGIALPTLARLDAQSSAMPSLGVALRLARAFGVNAVDLITDTPQ